VRTNLHIVAHILTVLVGTTVGDAYAAMFYNAQGVASEYSATAPSLDEASEAKHEDAGSAELNSGGGGDLDMTPK
jgi:hypothetical protein